jgi:hypothetical protein
METSPVLQEKLTGDAERSRCAAGTLGRRESRNGSRIQALLAFLMRQIV